MVFMSTIDIGELGLIDIDDLTDYEREIYEERAAIMEFDGGLARPNAEREALAEVQRQRGEK